MKVLQARLDAELLYAEDTLSEHERQIGRLAHNQTNEVLKEAVESRRLALMLIPSRLEQVFGIAIDHGISASFLRMLRAAKKHAASIPAPIQPSAAEWKNFLEESLAEGVESMIDVYDELRTGIEQVIYASSRTEQQLVEKGVQKIRELSRNALAAFYDLMEQAEFQRTYYDYLGWDLAIKRRGQEFRADTHKELGALSSNGEPLSSEPDMLGPDLDEEVAELQPSVIELFKRTETSFELLARQLMDNPSYVLDKNLYATFLVQVHGHLDDLSTFVQEILVNTTLRLRDDIVRARESMGMPRLPDDGLLRDVANMPVPPELQRRRISTPASEPAQATGPTSSMPEDHTSSDWPAAGEQMASVLPVGDISVNVVDEGLPPSSEEASSATPILSPDATIEEAATPASHTETGSGISASNVSASTDPNVLSTNAAAVPTAEIVPHSDLSSSSMDSVSISNSPSQAVDPLDQASASSVDSNLSVTSSINPEPTRLISSHRVSQDSVPLSSVSDSTQASPRSSSSINTESEEAPNVTLGLEASFVPTRSSSQSTTAFGSSGHMPVSSSPHTMVRGVRSSVRESKPESSFVSSGTYRHSEL